MFCIKCDICKQEREVNDINQIGPWERITVSYRPHHWHTEEIFKTVHFCNDCITLLSRNSFSGEFINNIYNKTLKTLMGCLTEIKDSDGV